MSHSEPKNLKVKTNDTTISIGGIFRCCLASAEEQIVAKPEWNIGDTVQTKCCNRVVELGTDTVWQVRFENE